MVSREGKGRLFTDPDPDAARQFFKDKSRAMTGKVTIAREAVSRLIHDGDYLAIGGFGHVRIPTAVLHEIVRQGRKDLGFAGHTSTHDFQILAAGRCLSRVDAAYVVGLEARGLSRNARRMMESGEVEVTEWSNAGLAWRLMAASMGLPFLPARNAMGTDTFAYSAARQITCPFTGKKLVAYPALYPDVCAVHVHEADVYGNARIKGITVSDVELAQASKRVIITTERIIPHERIRENPAQTSIPWFLVDAVVEVPFGSYPGNMPHEYYSDEEHLREWLAAEEDPERFGRFLKEYILDCRDFNEYLERCGGIERMRQLRSLEDLIEREQG